MNVSRKNPLHLSTLLIVAGTAFALLLIVIPGEIDDRYYARDFQQQSHGWPWVHLHRFVPKPNSEGEGREQLQQRLETYRKHGNPLPLIPIPGGRYWTSFENWTFWKGMLAPNWMGCLFNALSCTAILLAVGFPAYSVSDKDYRFLGRFSNLEVLCLRDIDLDKVRFEFPVLPKLVEICIDDNRVTPRVLEWLRQQPRLKTVKLWSAFSIDESRWHEVQSALPGTTIQDRLGEVHP